MKKIILSILSVSVIACSCIRNNSSRNGDVIISNEVNMEHSVLNFDNSRIENNAHSGQYFSRVDSINVFSAGYAYVIPDSLKEKNLKVYFSAWVREAEAPLQGGIAVALNTSKGTVFWNVFKVKNTNYVPFEWVQIKDSISFNTTLINDSKTELRIIGAKYEGKDKFDLDDLQIKYKFYK